jgi:hypothetical protein
MTKANKQIKKTDIPKNNQKKTKVVTNKIGDLFDIIDNYLRKKQNFFFWLFFAISILFTFLLFDLRVSVGGDDSTYIISADDLIKNFKYPSFQGPLYPIILSPFIAIFGINVPVLKLLSLIFLSAHLFFFFRAFRNKISDLILISTLILISINSYLLFFGSQTYTEAFFLMCQSLFFIYFFKNFITNDKQSLDIKHEIPKYLTLGLILLGLGLIKNIGYGVVFVVIIYFLFEKKWKPAGLALAGFGIAYGFWQFFKYLIWSDEKAQFTHQASTLFQKHPYDPSKGAETLFGYLQRFFENSNIYLSRQFFKILGLRPELIEINGSTGSPEPMPILTILIFTIFISGFIWAIRKNKYLKFVGIYMGVMLGLTFIILQTIWEAHRLIIPFFPLMIMLAITGLYSVFKRKELKILQLILPILIIIVFFSTFSRSAYKIKEHQKLLSSHLHGNITVGFSPDWVNFINMSIWAAKNVPEGKVIASRKPSISFIYTNRRFFGIYNVDTNNADSLLNYLHKYKVEYVIMASLRKFEPKRTDQIINTIQRFLYPIQQKYPEKLTLIHQIGVNDPDPEPAYLFKVE